MRVNKFQVMKGLLVASATAALIIMPSSTFGGKLALSFLATTLGSEISKLKRN